MDVLLIYDYLSEVGGVERVIATHAKWLQEKGHKVKLAFNYVDEETSKYDFFRGMEIVELSKIKFLKNESFKVFSSLIGFNDIRKFNPDIVIAYSFPSLFLSRKLKSKKAFYYLPMEFVYFPLKKRWEWANDLKRKIAFGGSFFLGPSLKVFDRRGIKNKLVIANSDFTRREIKERYQMKSIVSYPPLNEVFKPKKHTNKVLSKFNVGKKFVLTAGRIVPDKKTDWILGVFSKLPKDMEFVVAGDLEDSYKKSFISLAKELGVNNRLKLIGRVDQTSLVYLYSAAQAFLFASPKEAFGLVPIEAMACGCPVVAWGDNAGPSEYVIEGVNGYLAKPYNLNDFTLKAKKLIFSEFKKNNSKKIIKSVKKFTEKSQKYAFLENVEKLNNFQQIKIK